MFSVMICDRRSGTECMLRLVEGACVPKYARRLPQKLVFAKECVITHLPNQYAFNTSDTPLGFACQDTHYYHRQHLSSSFLSSSQIMYCKTDVISDLHRKPEYLPCQYNYGSILYFTTSCKTSLCWVYSPRSSISRRGQDTCFYCAHIM